VDGLRADLVMLRAARALAALEQAAAVTAEHVDRVAEAVLVHRRHVRESQAEGDARKRDAEREASSDSRASSAEGNAPPAAATGDSDWGYLAPEPAGTTHVKGVIPLNVKKR
jgi:magnesium chelatase subunit I